MTSLASSRSSVRPLNCFSLHLALLTASRCRRDVGSRRESSDRGTIRKSTFNVPRFLKSPEGELRSMCTAPTIATAPPVTRATSCTREITQTGESSAASREENVH